MRTGRSITQIKVLPYMYIRSFNIFVLLVVTYEWFEISSVTSQLDLSSCFTLWNRIGFLLCQAFNNINNVWTINNLMMKLLYLLKTHLNNILIHSYKSNIIFQTQSFSASKRFIKSFLAFKNNQKGIISY